MHNKDGSKRNKACTGSVERSIMNSIQSLTYALSLVLLRRNIQTTSKKEKLTKSIPSVMYNQRVSTTGTAKKAYWACVQMRTDFFFNRCPCRITKCNVTISVCTQNKVYNKGCQRVRFLLHKRKHLPNMS